MNPYITGGGAPFKFPCFDDVDPKDKKSGWQYSTVQCPGTPYGMANNHSQSYVASGSPVPFGRVLVRGPEGVAPYSAGFNNAKDPYFTVTDTAVLPDADGAWLKTPEGQTYAEAGLTLPVDGDGNLCILGVGKKVNETQCKAMRLGVPFGFCDQYYADPCEMVTTANAGSLWAYTETDLDTKSPLFFRIRITDSNPGSNQLLGAFLDNDDGGAAVPFGCGRVLRPGCAGCGFVLDLNGWPNTATTAPAKKAAEKTK